MNMINVRASALSDFLDCPARAEARHLLHLRTPSSGAATLGTALHKSTALYDQSKLDGQGLTIDETAGAAVDAINKPAEDVVWDDDESKPETEGIAIALHKLYCTKIAPTQDYAAVEVLCERLEIVDIGLSLTGTTTYTGLVVYNKPNSGKNLALLKMIGQCHHHSSKRLLTLWKLLASCSNSSFQCRQEMRQMYYMWSSQIQG